MMRLFKTITAAMAAALFAFEVGCAATTTVHKANQVRTAQLRAEVASLCAEMEQAMRDNDLRKVASYYADEAVLLSKNGHRRGGSRQAIDDYWAGFGQGVDWSLITHSVEGVGSLIVQRGRSILTYIRDGERRESTVEFLLIWQRPEGGELKIVTDAYW